MAKLDNVLSQTLNGIEAKLNVDLDIEKNRIRDDYFKTIPELAVKQARLKEIDKEQEALRKERNNVENEVRNLDPNVSKDVVRELNRKEELDMNVFSTKESDIAIAKAIKDTKAGTNMRAFTKIKTQIYNQFNLAITQKQKQQVILNLQTLIDWKGLGINIPNMFEITKVEVKDGVIKLDNALPDLQN